MIEEPAVVIDNDGDFSRVETQRKTTCGGCAANNTCGTSVLAKVFGQKRTVLIVQNTIGAQPGEQVILGLPDASLPKASFLLYILPLLSMLLFALAGEWLAQVNHLSTIAEPAAILCGLLGLLAGLKGVSIYTQRFDNDHNYQAIILRRANQSTVDFVTR
ncbi:MAG: SoxR reducing system RseC family protein [Chromatiales bacterium]|nr:SoxR reducing system RseC family protein [Chromatiales bacterium]